MEPVRVLQVVGAMYIGGLENFVMNLYRKADRTKLQFDFLYFTRDKSDFDDEILSMGGRIFCVCARGTSPTRHLKELKALFRAHPEWQTVHIHNSHTMCITDARLAKKAGRRVIVHAHASMANHRILHALFKPFLHRYADLLLACSLPAAAWMFSESDLKRGRVSLLQNGIPLEKFAPDPAVRESVRKELGLDGSFVLGHVGRLAEVKNHGFLLEVFAKTLEKIPNARLLAVGGGEREQMLKQKAKELGVFESVIFTGVCTCPERMLQAMDIFVFPSIFEGFPLTLVEAQAAGLTCLVSTAVTPEVLLTPAAHHLPLSAGAAVWADEVGKYVGENTHFDNLAALRAAGFDASHTAKQLFAYYLTGEMNKD